MNKFTGELAAHVEMAQSPIRNSWAKSNTIYERICHMELWQKMTRIVKSQEEMGKIHSYQDTCVPALFFIWNFPVTFDLT